MDPVSSLSVAASVAQFAVLGYRVARLFVQPRQSVGVNTELSDFAGALSDLATDLESLRASGIHFDDDFDVLMKTPTEISNGLRKLILEMPLRNRWGLAKSRRLTRRAAEELTAQLVLLEQSLLSV